MLFAIKRPVEVEVEFARSDGDLESLEGRVVFREGDALLRGSDGERWAVGRTRFDQTYEPCAGASPGRPGVYRKRPTRVAVARIEEETSVETRHGTLHGQPGDWLVQDASGECWVVANAIFVRDYELLDD